VSPRQEEPGAGFARLRRYARAPQAGAEGRRSAQQRERAQAREAETAKLIELVRAAVERTNVATVARGCRLTPDVVRGVLRGKRSQRTTLDKLRRWLPTLAVVVAVCACGRDRAAPDPDAYFDTAMVNRTGVLCGTGTDGLLHCYNIERHPAPAVEPDTHPLSCARRPPPCFARD